MSTRYHTATIANGAAVSDAISLINGERITGVIVPSAWTAADIGFSVSVDGTTFYEVADVTRTTAGTSEARIINVVTNAAAFYAVPAVMDLEFGGFVKLTSVNTANNADVNQGAARSLIVTISKR